MSAAGESLFERYKDEVRLLLSLRDLVEEIAPKHLRATGKSSILCCSPLRQDRHPSFSVFEGGGEYIAFDHATRESFDLFGYVEKKEGLSFVEAVKWVGERVNRPWDEYKKQHGGESGGRTPPPAGFTEAEWERAYEATLALDERQMVANVQQAMVDLCHGMFLRSSLPQYVTERWGISEETQRRFLLGFVPHGFADLLEAFHEQGIFPYTRKQLVKTGWFTFRARVPGDPDPPLRCTFDGRLLYPYLFRGKCRYACARILYEDRIDRSYFETRPWEEAKFKKALVGGPSHPSVSPLVQNNVLYNADNGYRSRTGFARLVIVEGPSDCMTLVEHGYDCVAPVATSIRTEDVPMLLESAAQYKEVVLATDTDVKPDGRRPGLEGALRMAPELMRAGKRVKLLVFPLPKGESKVDPASWALGWKRAGKEGDPFAELMAEAPTVAAALVGFLDTGLTAAQLPEALNAIVGFARAAKASKAETDEIARLVQKRLNNNFTRSAIKQAMGEADERIEAETRATEAAKQAVEDVTLALEGTVLERGGHDQIGKTRCYQSYGKDDLTTISTFILQPSRIIIASNGERLLEVSVHIETDTALIDRWVVPKKAWTGRKDFVSSFPHERMQFNGSDFNVHAVQKIVSERATRLGVPTVRGEPIVGLHRTPGGLRLVLPTETWSAEGVMDNPDIVYASDTGSVPFCAMIKVDGHQDPAEIDALAERLLALLFKLNDPVKLTTICAWTTGCYFLPEIRELNGGKASILNVFGSPGAAKTTTMKEVVSKTLQPFGPNFEPAAPAETRFATIRNLSWSNVFVTTFDEYRTSEAGGDFMRLLRTGFSGGSEMRGSRDQSVRGYSLFGAVLLLGEQRADIDAAMSERLVMVGLDRTTIETRNADAAVHEILAIDERWRLASDILQWRMRIDAATVRGWWADARVSAFAALDRMKLKVAPRTRDLCAELAFRVRAWTEWLDHRFGERQIEVPRPPLDALLRQMLETTSGVELPEGGGNVITVSAKSLVVRALEDVSAYAVSGQFEDRKCYRLAVRSGRLMLVVHPGSLATTLAKEARSRGGQDPTNGEAALKRAAKEEYDRSGDTGWLVDPNFPYRMGSADEVGEDRGRTVRMRCWLIDVEKAHERVGLELDWPGTPATWGGDRKTVTSLPLPAWRKVGEGGGTV